MLVNNDVNVAASEGDDSGPFVEKIAALVVRNKDWLAEVALREEDVQESFTIVERKFSLHTPSGTRPPRTVSHCT